MTALAVTAAGVVLIVVGLAVTFGAWTMIPAGLVLAVLGILVDFEGALNGKPVSPSP